MLKRILNITCLVLLSFGLNNAHGQEKTALSALSQTPGEAMNSIKFRKIFSIQHNEKTAEQLIVRPQYIRSLDSLLEDAVSKGVFPGCQVFASINGQVIYQKSFGFYTYDQSPKVTDSTLFDIASVTKIMATTLSVMKLVDMWKIDLDKRLKDYLPDLVAGTDKENLKIRDLLLHQAGLKAWIPFYKNTLDSLTKNPRADLYRTVAEKGYNIPVAAKMFMKNAYLQTVWEEILNSPLENKGKYVYSDLDFYFLQKIVEEISGMTLSEFVQTHFYQPLGLRNILYNPWQDHRVNECAPTENDNYFRYRLLQGYVHDQGAAMMGGVAGHAGIFANATDIGVILQMLLNGGIYQHHRYLERKTVWDFTEYHSKISRRGLGFDKPEKEAGQGGPAADICSKSSFGHQGFTGTCAWADPESGIVFVLLCNRVYPTADNWLITRLSTRTVAQEYIYKALGYGS